MLKSRLSVVCAFKLILYNGIEPSGIEGNSGVKLGTPWIYLIEPWANRSPLIPLVAATILSFLGKKYVISEICVPPGSGNKWISGGGPAGFNASAESKLIFQTLPEADCPVPGAESKLCCNTATGLKSKKSLRLTLVPSLFV